MWLERAPRRVKCLADQLSARASCLVRMRWPSAALFEIEMGCINSCDLKWFASLMHA